MGGDGGQSAGKQVQSVSRALDVLFLIAQSSGHITVADLAAALDLPRPTVYRLTDTLVSYGVVARKRDGLVAAPRLFLLTSGRHSAMALEDVLEPYLGQLRDITQETAGLHVRIGNYRRIIAEVEGHHGIRWTRGVGFTMPVWTGAVGHVFMAGLSDREVDDLLRQAEIDPVGPDSPTSPEEIQKKVELARVRGWSYSQAETLEGSAAIAAPIEDRTGTTAVLGVYAPLSRRAVLRRSAHDLVALAAKASEDWIRLSSRSSELRSP